MAQIYITDNGTVYDPFVNDSIVTNQDVLSEFDNNRNKLQAEYKRIKDKLDDSDKLGFVESIAKEPLCEAIVKYRNSLI